MDSTGTITVRKLLPFCPGKLNESAEDFLSAVRETVRTVKEENKFLYDYGLTDIGFVPLEEQIEIRLYFSNGV